MRLRYCKFLRQVLLVSAASPMPLLLCNSFPCFKELSRIYWTAGNRCGGRRRGGELPVGGKKRQKGKQGPERSSQPHGDHPRKHLRRRVHGGRRLADHVVQPGRRGDHGDIPRGRHRKAVLGGVPFQHVRGRMRPAAHHEDRQARDRPVGLHHRRGREPHPDQHLDGGASGRRWTGRRRGGNLP